ncbi:ABC transporter substrate-binding protein [Flindersiella endophytica]
MRKTPVELAAALLLALVVGLGGCGGANVRGEGDDGDSTKGASAAPERKTGPIKLAVVPKAVGFDFWEQVKVGAECAASKHKDVTVQWDGVQAETNVSGQVDLLSNFITQGVDGLVYAATDAKVLADVTAEAKRAGLVVVNIDSGTDPQPADVALFATDNEASATKAADLLASALGKGNHDIALIPFQPGTATNDQRVEGFTAGLAKHPNLKKVAEQSSESDYNEGLRVTEDILTAHPDLDGIFAANEPGVLGAAEAVRQAGKAGKVKIIGWDAAPDELKAVRDGTIDALVVQNPFRMGYDGVNAAVSALRDGKSPKNTDTGVTFVTKENIDSPEVKAVLKPSCANPPTG